MSTDKKKILVVGGCGVGKSSIIKLLTQNSDIQTSNKVLGCTTQLTEYQFGQYILVDTVGLNEGTFGTTQHDKSKHKLTQFCQNNLDGFALIMLVRECGRFNNLDEINYHVYYQLFGQSKIPIVIVNTHGENYAKPNDWWETNQLYFIQDYQMKIAGGLSVCSIDSVKEYSENYQQWLLKIKKMSYHDLIALIHEKSANQNIALRRTDDLVSQVIDYFKTKFPSKQNNKSWWPFY